MRMRLFRPPLLLLLIIFFCGGCQTGSLAGKCWFYTFQTGAADNANSKLTPVSFLAIRTNGTYTRDFGSFDYGTWTAKEKLLLLTNEKNETSAIHILSITGNEMKTDLGQGVTADFESQPLPGGSDASDDPFSYVNNRWRIRATAKETDTQLRERLINHCAFWIAYFSWALNTKQETVDVRSTASPIKIYGNGFTLKSFADETDRWKSYFFDEADCMRANEILNAVVSKKTIALPHTDNKYKMFIGTFQQLAQALRHE